MSGQPERPIGLLERAREWRRAMAPPGSRREKLARCIYIPLVHLMPSRWRFRLRTVPPTTAEVTYIGDINVRGFKQTPIKRLIVFKLDHIGDMIIGMRAMRMLREGFPDAHVTLVCASWNRTWAESLKWFDRIVTFDFFSTLNRDWNVTKEALNDLYRGIETLPLETYDLGIDLRHDPDTRPCLYRVRTTYRVGFEAPPEPGMPYLDLVLPSTEGMAIEEDLSRSLHADLRLQVLAAATVAAFAPSRPHPARSLITEPVVPYRPFAVLAIGAGDPIRCWPIERYAAVGRQLIARYDMDLVILGGTKEQADAARLAASLPAERVRMAIGRPLADLPQLVAGATLCVCNGSGMSHLAAALDVATVCILGGTTRMEVWHPAGPSELYVGGSTPHQPCGLKDARECPWDVVCLTAVSTAHVLDACDRLMAAHGRTIASDATTDSVV